MEIIGKWEKTCQEYIGVMRGARVDQNACSDNVDHGERRAFLCRKMCFLCGIIHYNRFRTKPMPLKTLTSLYYIYIFLFMYIFIFLLFGGCTVLCKVPGWRSSACFLYLHHCIEESYFFVIIIIIININSRAMGI